MSRTGGRVRIQLASQSEQLVEQQERYQQEFLSSPTFQQLVDETSSAKIEEAVSVAIEETITQGGFEGRGEGIGSFGGDGTVVTDRRVEQGGHVRGGSWENEYQEKEEYQGSSFYDERRRGGNALWNVGAGGEQTEYAEVLRMTVPLAKWKRRCLRPELRHD